MQDIHQRSNFDRTVDSLNRLESLAGRLEGYFGRAAGATALRDLAGLLQIRASEWTHNVAELHGLIARQSAASAPGVATEPAAVFPADTDPAAGADGAHLIADCVRAEDAAAAAYQRVLETPDLAPRLRFALSRQLEATYTNRMRLRARSEALS